MGGVKHKDLCVMSTSVSFVSKPFEVQSCGLGLSLGTFSNLIMDKCVKLLL